MADETPYAPIKSAPVAVVARPRETPWQLDQRLAGASDVDTGYSGPNESSSGDSAMARAANLSLLRDRENRIAADAKQAQNFQERGLSLREKEFALNSKIHENSMREATAAHDQGLAYQNELNAIAQDPESPVGSKAYYQRALTASGKYPAAVNANPRISAQLSHFDTQLSKLTDSKDVGLALADIGAIDVGAEGAQDLLRSIPSKYPGAMSDAGVRDLFNKSYASARVQGGYASREEAQNENPGLSVHQNTKGRWIVGSAQTDVPANVKLDISKLQGLVAGKAKTIQSLSQDPTNNQAEIQKQQALLDEYQGQIDQLHKDYVPAAPQGQPNPSRGSELIQKYFPSK